MSRDEVMHDLQRPVENKYLDLVNIVRCKNCIHCPTGYYESERDRYPIFPDEVCPCRVEEDEFYSWIPDPNWFCPKGERKQEH